MINIIEGTDGPNYDASFGDPGDGLGVLAHAADRKHAGFAAGAAEDDAVIGTHGQLVDQYGKNAADWATLARDTALSDVLTQSNAALAKLFVGPGVGTDPGLSGDSSKRVWGRRWSRAGLHRGPAHGYLRA